MPHLPLKHGDQIQIVPLRVRLGSDPTADLIEAIAERAADLVEQRQAARDDGWLRGAEAIATYIDAAPDRVYALSSANRIPVQRDGSALLAKRSELDEWVRNGGGKRP